MNHETGRGGILERRRRLSVLERELLRLLGVQGSEIHLGRRLLIDEAGSVLLRHHHLVVPPAIGRHRCATVWTRHHLCAVPVPIRRDSRPWRRLLLLLLLLLLLMLPSCCFLGADVRRQMIQMERPSLALDARRHERRACEAAIGV
jgi:hypothetical protein